MAGKEQPNKSDVHRLTEKGRKTVTAVLENNRWTISITTTGQILTNRDIHQLMRSLSVERRRQEHKWRQEVRKQARLQEQKV